MVIQESNYSLEVSRPALTERRLRVNVSKPRANSPFENGDKLFRSASVNCTGFEADSLEQAEEYALAVLEAVTLARNLNLAFEQSLVTPNDHPWRDQAAKKLIK